MKQKTAPAPRRQATDTGDTDDRPQGWTREQGQPRKGTTRPTETARRGGHPDRLFFHATKQEQPTTATTDTGHPAPADRRPRRRGDTGDRPQGWTDSRPTADGCETVARCLVSRHISRVNFTPLTSPRNSGKVNRRANYARRGRKVLFHTFHGCLLGCKASTHFFHCTTIKRNNYAHF